MHTTSSTSTDYLTARQAAPSLGMSARTVQRLAKQHGRGIKITERLRLLSPSDLDFLRQFVGRSVGNPLGAKAFGKLKKSRK